MAGMRNLPAAQPTIEDGWRASKARGTNFDAIRLLAAALVIFSHAFAIRSGGRPGEPLAIITGQISFGLLAVLIFFAVSGFLIARSWAARPSFVVFARNRALRIMPALIACVGALALIGGPLLTTHSFSAYFADPRVACFLLNAAFDSACGTLPGVFDGRLVNAPLWTLAFEVQCYAIVALLGVMRILTAPACAGLAIALIIAGAYGAATGFGGSYLYKITLLAPSFLMGAFFALTADRTPLDHRLAVVSALALFISIFTGTLVVAFAFFGVYLVLWFAFAPLGAAVRNIGARGDFSYGVYLWGWPVQQAFAMLVGHGPLLNFLLSLPVAFALAILSWRFIEAPALTLRTRSPRAFQKPAAPPAG